MFQIINISIQFKFNAIQFKSELNWDYIFNLFIYKKNLISN